MEPLLLVVLSNVLAAATGFLVVGSLSMMAWCLAESICAFLQSRFVREAMVQPLEPKIEQPTPICDCMPDDLIKAPMLTVDKMKIGDRGSPIIWLSTDRHLWIKSHGRVYDIHEFNLPIVTLMEDGFHAKILRPMKVDGGDDAYYQGNGFLPIVRVER